MRATQGYVTETTAWLILQKMQRVFMIQNFKGTERWKNKAKNTQTLYENKLVFPPVL